MICFGDTSADIRAQRGTKAHRALTRLSPHATRMTAVGKPIRLCKLRFLRIATVRAVGWSGRDAQDAADAMSRVRQAAHRPPRRCGHPCCSELERPRRAADASRCNAVYWPLRRSEPEGDRRLRAAFYILASLPRRQLAGAVCAIMPSRGVGRACGRSECGGL